jgi:tubulin monoglycylase TTLL3/8
MEKKGSDMVVAAHVSQVTGVDSLLKNHLNHGSPIGALVKIDESGQTTVTTIGKDARIKYSFDSELTFTPKLNETSLKLAKERGRRWKESYASRQAAQIAEQESVFTFKPRVSLRSERIAQRLNSTFHSRQQRHLERRQQMMEHPPQQRTRLDGQQYVHTLPKTLSVSHMHSSISSESHPHIPSPSKSLCNVAEAVTPSSETALAPVESPIDIQEKALNEKLHNCQMRNQERKTPDESYQRTVEKSSCLTSVVPPRKSRNDEKHHRNLSCPVSSQRNEDSWSVVKLNNSCTARTKSVSACYKSPQESYPCKGGFSKSTPSSPPRHFDNNIDICLVKRAKEAASTAIKGKKVFLCLGPYTPIRQSLRRRGWVEKNYKGPLGAVKLKKKLNSKSKRQLKLSTKISDNESDLSSSSDSDSDLEMVDQLVQSYREEFSDDGEYMMTSRAVRSTYPHFVWTCKRDDIEFRFLRKDQIVSHYQQAVSFTTKVGLCKNLRNLVWFTDTDPNTFFPRCYQLCVDEEKKSFIEDFRLMAAIGILKWFVENPHRRTFAAASGQYAIHSERKMGEAQNDGDEKDAECSGVVPGRAVSLAVAACKEFISSQDHDDIDVPLSNPPALSDNDWNDVIQFSYQLTHRKQSNLSVSEVNYNTVVQLLEELKGRLPQFELDGLKNVWIIKPGAKSRGRGIFCLDQLEPILDLVSSTVQKKESRLIIQKYIERPLLIYDTKFDIRQWFLVTDWNPLTLWIYKKCYLRFSTQLFTLENLDQSVHLCNNSIQKYYENAPPRSSDLPEDNMWDNEQFEEFLKAQGAGKVWDEVIYPGMKEALVGVLLTTQDDMDLRKNSFELFGADFMITEDFRPWLIEVNSSPAMSASASVTARLCPQVMEDTLKVVLDRRHDKTADVGYFELAYKQPCVPIPTYLGMQLVVQGHQMNSNRQSQKNSCGSNHSRSQSSVSILPPYPVTCLQVNSDCDNDNETKDSRLIKGVPAVACQPVKFAADLELQHAGQQQRLQQKKGAYKRSRVAHMAQVCLRTITMNKTHSRDLAVFGAKTGRQNLGTN